MRAVRGINQIKRPKVFLPLLLVLGVVIGAVAIIRNLNAPAVGSINQTPPAHSVQLDPYAQPGKYSGKLISFSYPAHYKKIPSQLTGSYREVADYHTTDTTGKQISVGVMPGSFATSSDIQFRRQQKNLYTENDTQRWIEFDKNDGTEHTFFFEHGGLLASVSATAPFNDQSGDGLYVASSLKWL